MVGLAVLLLGAACLNYCVEWDARASDAAAPLPAGALYRSEYHLLFGHGFVAVTHFFSVQDHPFTAQESHMDAWACFLSSGLSRSWPTYWEYPAGRPWLSIPCWTPLVIVVPLAFYLVWRDRRLSRPGRCEVCGYDRRGLVGGADAKCPECGTVPS
jgi:hypothetical protein